jgi:hypothetical protein
MLTQIHMDAKLAESLQQAAEQRGANVEEVMNDLARKYVREARREKIRLEFESYQKMHTELKAKYLGQHVAIYSGQLIDHDADVSALVKRIRQQYGREPVLITQVHEQAVREFVIRSPRLVRST